MFYFEVSPFDKVFFITPKKFYDKNGCLSDKNNVVPKNVLPNGFFELAESTYEYDGLIAEGKESLLKAGFIEHQLIR